MARRTLVLLLAGLTLLGILGATGAGRAEDAAPAPVVREILVTGTVMVEAATVRSRIKSQEGAPYDPDQVSRDVRAVYDLGYFEDVTVDAEGFEGGLRVTFKVAEKPVVREVRFEGNKELKEEDLKEKAALVAHTALSAVAVADAVERIKALYREKGYYQAVVRTRTDPAGQGQVTLAFVIEEGEKYRLVAIRFTGNKEFPEEELRRQMKSAEWNLFSYFLSSGKLQHEQLQEDRQQVVTFYQDNGFLEARVGEPAIRVDDQERTLEVTIPVTEGLRYRLGSVELKGDDLVSLAEVREILGINEGEIFRRSAFAKALFEITQRYTSRGYAFAKVDYRTQLDTEKRTIAVTFLVERGNEARIGRIAISGNVSTRDKVVRRALTFVEGDRFDSAALRRSRQHVMNLGFFDTVDIVPRPRADDTIDIEITVKERLTGMISLGVGYSSEDRASAQVRISENNLFGLGQTLQFMTEYSKVRRNFSITFSEPAVLDSKYSAGFSLYNTLREFDEYDRKNVGGKLTVGHPLWEFIRANLILTHETVTISDVADTASSYIKEQEGEATTNSIGLSLVRDTRDNYMNPTRGNRTSVSGEYAGGPFGGDNSFTKFEAESSNYFPLFWKLVFMAHGQYGKVSGFDGKQPPIYEKFFLGGITSLRGFAPRSVGPMDENDEPMGGYQQVLFNAEVIVPIAPEQGFNVVFFYDTGNTWDKGKNVDLGDLRASTGVGIRWMSPIGPFRLEWGYILDRQEGEKASDWAFMIGNFF
jgi:outer membrane protein insertion porin family